MDGNLAMANERVNAKEHDGEDNGLYYVQDSRQFVGNCLLFWRKGGNGYTTDLSEAQLYTREEAEKICRNRATDKMWPIEQLNALASITVDVQRMP